jgi:hypothetical protein
MENNKKMTELDKAREQLNILRVCFIDSGSEDSLRQVEAARHDYLSQMALRLAELQSLHDSSRETAIKYNLIEERHARIRPLVEAIKPPRHGQSVVWLLGAFAAGSALWGLEDATGIEAFDFPISDGVFSYMLARGLPLRRMPNIGAVVERTPVGSPLEVTNAQLDLEDKLMYDIRDIEEKEIQKRRLFIATGLVIGGVFHITGF